MKDDLEKLGYQVEDINGAGYQFRINGAIDIYPKRRKYFDLKTRHWGTYNEIKSFLKFEFKTSDAKPKAAKGVEKKENTDTSKQAKVEKILQNVERRMLTKKIASRPRQILAEEIIKYL